MPHSAGGENFGPGSFRDGIVVIEAIVYDAGNNELAATSKLLKPHGIAAKRQNRAVNFTGGPGYTFAGRDIPVKTWDGGFRIPAARKPSRQSMRLLFPEKGFRLSNSWL